MDLNIQNVPAEVKAVTLRTENNGDEKVLAVNVKLECTVPMEQVAPLFSDTPKLLPTFFDKGGNVVNPVTEMRYRIAVENVRVQIDDLKPIDGARILKSMRLTPVGDSCFTVLMVVKLPDVHDTRPFANRLHEQVRVSIAELQASLDLDEEAA